jgi:hypothetical protein
MLAPNQCSEWSEAPAHHWLENVRGTVSEQSMGQQNGFRMTLLTFEPEDDDPDEVEDVERAWAPPRFSKR